MSNKDTSDSTSITTARRRQILQASATGVALAGLTLSQPVAAQEPGVDIRHAQSSLSLSGADSGKFYRARVVPINITADEPIDFGGDTGRSLRVINSDTGRQVTLDPVADSEAVSAGRLRLSAGRTGIVSTEVDAIGLENRDETAVSIDVDANGDTESFPERTVGRFTVELLDDDNSVISATDERIVAAPYQYNFEQDGTTFRITRNPEVSEDWEVTFAAMEDTFSTLDVIPVDNNDGDDTFEIDLTALDVPDGEYGWNLRIEAPGDRRRADVIALLDNDPDAPVQIKSGDRSPTEIEDWNDFDAIRNELAGDYVLVTDLDEATPGYDDVAGPAANDGLGFEPVGTEDDPFVGSFDGQHNEIQGLHIERPDEDAVGLFGIISGLSVEPAVHSLDLDVHTVVGSGDSSEGGVGTVAGGVFGVRTISDVSVTGDQVHATDRYAGGLIGSCWEATDVVIENSTADITVKHTGGDGRAGGLVGGGRRVTITNCSVSGDVVAEGDRIGGLVGNGATKIIDSEATGDVKTDGESTEADGDRVGGLVGYLQSGSEITGSSAIGDVTGRDTVGGLVGIASFDPPTLVEDCGAEGSVTSTETDDFASVGGLIGENQGEVVDSYATGDVTGQSGGTRGDYVGGLIGDDYGDIRRCFATGLVEGQDTVGGLVGSNDLVDGSSLDGVVENCYATGHVQAAASSDDVGGLVGKNWRSITTSFATGAVSGGGNNGGLVGSVDADAALTDSYWDTESTGHTTASGSGDSDATGLTTDEMQGTTAEENLSTLDFEAIWQVEANPDRYPTLQTIDVDPGVPDEEPDEPDESGEKHESGVDQAVFDAIDEDGDGTITLEQLVEANLERLADPDGAVNGVEITLEELVELNIWRLSG